jgi:hypothetical protein
VKKKGERDSYLKRKMKHRNVGMLNSIDSYLSARVRNILKKFTGCQKRRA